MSDTPTKAAGGLVAAIQNRRHMNNGQITDSELHSLIDETLGLQESCADIKHILDIFDHPTRSVSVYDADRLRSALARLNGASDAE